MKINKNDFEQRLFIVQEVFKKNISLSKEVNIWQTSLKQITKS
ncbi:N-myc-interactor [Listeria seeligeri FSL S4-171]|nr:N-myc-interactor [Listeria seeligeri FSL S4-171]